MIASELILESCTEALQLKRTLEGTGHKQCYKSDFETVAVSFTSGSYYGSEVPAKPYMSVPLNIKTGPVSIVNHACISYSMCALMSTDSKHTGDICCTWSLRYGLFFIYSSSLYSGAG